MRIDALGPPAADLIYTKVGQFQEDETPLGEATQAVQTIALNPEFGAAALLQLLSPLPADDNGQGLVVTFANSLGDPRARDALQAVAAPPLNIPRNAEVLTLLGPGLPSWPRFNALKVLSPAAMPATQRMRLKNLRDALRRAAPGENLARVVRTRDMRKFLDGTFDPKAFGFWSVAQDVAHLRTPADLIEGLRLDYPGGFQNENEVAVLTFAQTSEFSLNIPYSPANGGERTDPYPLTGTGFTASVRGQVGPEWLVPRDGVPLGDGATLVLVQADGTHQLQGTLANGQWNNIAARRLPRTPVDRRVTYRGISVLLISRDEQFYHVYVDSAIPEGFLDEQLQVGPEEYRGKLPLTAL
jgi:hypothetical protein